MATNAVKIPFTEAAAPSTPAASKVVVYAKTDGLMYSKDDAGTETLMSSGPAGSVATDAIWDAAGDTVVGSGANTAVKRKNNDGAAVAPAVTDDSGDGYAVGSRWIDTTADQEYVALDVTVGAAVWTETTAAGGSGSITASGYTQSTAKMLGRSTAATGAIEEITVGSGLSLSAGSLTATGGGGGALVLLEQYTASASATLDFTTFISATYDDYVFRLIGLVPVTNNVDFYMRLSVSGAFDSGANYVNNSALVASTGDTAVKATLTAFAARNAAEIGNTAASGLSGHIDLFNPQSTVLGKRIGGNIRWSGSAGNYINSIMDGYWTTSGSAVDGVRFLFSSGNIASGTIRVYGIAKS